MLAISLGPTSSTGTTTTAPSGTAPILLAPSVTSRLRMPVSPVVSTGKSTPATGYACNAGTCTGYGDTAVAFASLQSLLNQAVLSVGDVGQPPAIAVSGTIDSATLSLVWWLHNSTYPQLFPELNAAMASGDAQWIADNVDTLISELHTFVSQYLTPPPIAPIGPRGGYIAPPPPPPPPPSTDTGGDGTAVTSTGGTSCPDGYAWDPTSGTCQLTYVPEATPPPGVWACPVGTSLQPNMVPGPNGLIPDPDHQSCQPTPAATLQPVHIGALAIGGVILGALAAFFHR